MDLSDTIAAVATAPGRGGVAVVRVSGPDAFSVARRVAGSVPEPGRTSFARFRRGDAVVDSGVVLSFASPRSYTGEDVVELQCHGGSVAPRRVLEACIAAGARLARRGEFTQRAFLNGKIGYEQAEAVLDFIDAKTDRAADAAMAELDGQGAANCETDPVRSLYSSALELSSTVEHALDVSEEDLGDAYFLALSRSLSGFLSSVRDARRRLGERRLLRDGALVVLAGPPNAGKSSLLNALLGEDRAIVSSVPGTTRDSIEAWLDVGGWPVRLVDTAGLRESADSIEAEGVRRSEDLVSKADVVVLLEPTESQVAGDSWFVSRLSAMALAKAAGSCPVKQSEQSRRSSSSHEPGTQSSSQTVKQSSTILVSSKCDVARGDGLNVSAVTGEGLDALRLEIAARLERLAETSEAAEDDVSTIARKSAALVEAEAALAPFAAEAQPDLVLLGNALRRACVRLGELSGSVYSEDLLDSLFSRFCVGK